MSIEFTCPNGHRLSTKDDDAGKMAKCPKCGAVTKVPGLNGSAGKDSKLESAAVVASGSAKGLAATAEIGASKSGVAAVKPLSDLGKAAVGGGLPTMAGLTPPTPQANGGKPSGPAGEESIVFLCPSGHKLNAPRRMQGHAGKCPHCGAKFRIPYVDESGAEDEGSRVDDLGNFQELIDTPAPAPAERPTGQPQAEPSQPRGDDFSFWGEPETHPLASLVMRLWSEREHGGVIELHLQGGAILLPDWFERRLSQGPHGLFAAQAADGTVTMTIVPWETITRVVVRGVVGLPDGMFE